MPSDTVTYETTNNIATITLNRPRKLNAINHEMVDALEASWRRFSESDDRVAILTGAGENAFCAGADLEHPPEEVWRAIPGHIVAVDKPIITAVFGHCLGGGLGLVHFSDLCVAAEDTRFAFPEARVGFALGGASSLVARIPHKIAMELMLTGNIMTAGRAYDVGLVNSVVPRARLMDEAMAYAKRLADNAPMVLTLLKQYVDTVLPKGPVELLALASRGSERILASQDAKEGPAAFRDGRKAEFLGR